jgi:thiamine-monophosphate kinase
MEGKDQKFTNLDQIGEFGLIDILTKDFESNNKSTVLSIGDDAAVIDNSKEKTLISTDMLVEGVHFDLSYFPLKHLGYKAVISSISDIYAMNGICNQITVSIAVSNRFKLESINELYSGIKVACKNYKVDLIGGDTTSSKKGLIISVTALGISHKNGFVARSGAEDNDLIVVSGNLGGAYLGLQVLEREKQVFLVNPNSKPDLSKYKNLVQRQLRPEARIDIIEFLHDSNVKPTSMIDISDGLSSEIIHICKSSKKGCNIYEDKIPISNLTTQTCNEFNLESTTVALSGGEDYELLFTIKQEDLKEIEKNPDLSIIGHINSKKKMNLVTKTGKNIAIKSMGWKSF